MSLVKCSIILATLFSFTHAEAYFRGEPALRCLNGEAYITHTTMGNCYGKTVPYIKMLTVHTTDYSLEASKGSVVVEMAFKRIVGEDCGNPRGWPETFKLPLHLKAGTWEVSVDGKVSQISFDNAGNCSLSDL